MKRTRVMKIFYPIPSNETVLVNTPWIDAKKQTPSVTGLFMVKLEGGDMIYAYYYVNRPTSMDDRGIEPTHWWAAQTEEPLYTVKQWREVKDAAKEVGKDGA